MHGIDLFLWNLIKFHVQILNKHTHIYTLYICTYIHKVVAVIFKILKLKVGLRGRREAESVSVVKNLKAGPPHLLRVQ